MHKPCAGCTVQNVPRPAVPLFTFVVVVVVVVMYGGLMTAVAFGLALVAFLRGRCLLRLSC